jgi:hypothetical protein
MDEDAIPDVLASVVVARQQWAETEMKRLAARHVAAWLKVIGQAAAEKRCSVELYIEYSDSKRSQERFCDLLGVPPDNWDWFIKRFEEFGSVYAFELSILLGHLFTVELEPMMFGAELRVNWN